MSSSPSFGAAGGFGTDVVFLTADREPCPVCGHPTGDCVGDTPPSVAPRVQFAPLEKPQAKEPMVLVEEDIWQDVQITALTKTRVLVAKAGTQVSLTRARELGIV